MEVKKTRRADLEKGKSRWLFMGLIVTLSFMFVSFEWTERNVTYTISDLVSDPDFFEELVPVTYNQDINLCHHRLRRLPSIRKSSI